MSAYPVRYWEDVEIGEALPAFDYELSLMRMVAVVRATGLYDPVHYDTDYARSAGARDAFISTPHVAGLLRRLLTDWSGPEADVRTLAFRMNSQSCRGDMLHVGGRVSGKYRADNGDHIVEIADIRISHALDATAVTGTATMALPSRRHGPVSVAPRSAPSIGADDLAQTMALHPVSPLSGDQIHLWCEAMEDWNPLYWDAAYAARSRHGGIVAPFGEWMFGAGFGAAMGIGWGKPGEAVPPAVRDGLTGPALVQALRKELSRKLLETPLPLADFPEIAVGDIRMDWTALARPGDSLFQRVSLAGQSPLKTTRLGSGHFLTFAYENYDADGSLLSVMTIVLLQYHVDPAPKGTPQ